MAASSTASMKKRTVVDIEDVQVGKCLPRVLTITRRGDVPANPKLLRKMFEMITAGKITMLHPMFGNECKPVDPREYSVIEWWSKDFRYFIEMWNEFPVLKKWKHRFVFTINNEKNSLLEPNITTTIAERIAQTGFIAAIAAELGQEMENTLELRVDPISKWIDQSTGLTHDNTGHIPDVCAAIRRHGLTRLHISFTQHFPKTDKRVREAERWVKLIFQTKDEQDVILREKIAPYAAGISIETCCTPELVKKYSADDNPMIKHGACSGTEPIQAITNCGKPIPKKGKRTVATSDCICARYKDVGTKQNPCILGCLYCFVNPVPWHPPRAQVAAAAPAL